MPLEEEGGRPLPCRRSGIEVGDAPPDEGKKSLRKSAQSGLCDAKSDALPESFFRYCSSRWRASGQVTGDRCMVVRERAARRRQEKKSAFYRCFFSGACLSFAFDASAVAIAPPSPSPSGAGQRHLPRKKVARRC
ncbi:MAG: hypothetical protein NVV67_09690 [Pseudoxanthomonas sp.]|nr:hypothetical protein [Pseudoxanthomonas sp.]